MRGIADHARLRIDGNSPGLLAVLACWIVLRIASIILLAWFCVITGICPSQAAPRTGPDRPFMVGWRVTTSPAPHLRAAAFAPGTQTSIAVGDSGTIFRSSDGGRSWNRPMVPSDLKFSLLALAFANASDAVAVGEDGTILRTSDGGQTWSLITTPAISAHLRAVIFTGPTAGIAVGDQGTILRTLDGGKSWHRANVRPENVGDLRAVAFGQTGAGIAVGTKDTILFTVDGGENWDASRTPTRNVPGKPWLSREMLQLSTVLFIGENIALAAGGTDERSFSTGAEQPILRSEDRGRTWKFAAMPAGIASDINAIRSTSSMNAVAVGSAFEIWHSASGSSSGASGIGGSLYSTTDGGESWKREQLERIETVHTLTILSRFPAISVGSNGLILRRDDDALSWRRATVPSGVNIEFTAIAFADSDNGIVVGNNGVILWTKDGGKRFEKSILPYGIMPERLRTVVLTGPADAIAIGARPTIVRTEDGGKSWQDVKRPPSLEADLHAVKFVNSLTGIIVGDAGTILFTDDGGKSWQSAAVPPSIKADLTAIAFFDFVHAVVVGSDGTILWSDNAGKSWQQTSSGVKADLRAVVSSGPSVGIVVGDGGVILRTQDNGKSWEAAKTPPGLGVLRAITFSEPSVGIAVGDKANDKLESGTIVWTADGGKTWELAKRPSRLGNFRDVVLQNGLNGVAVGDLTTVDSLEMGTIVWTADGGRSWQRSTMAGDAPLPKVSFNAIVLTPASTGLAVGGASILSTRDNGKRWVPTSIVSRPDAIDLAHIAFNGSSGLGIAVGSRGVRLVSDAPNYAAYLADPMNSVHQSLGGRIDLDVHTVDDEGDTARVLAVEYSLSRKDRTADWKRLNEGLTKSRLDGHWRMSWSPSDELIGNGATIEHRVFLDDGGSPLEPITLNSVVFRSFRERLSDYQSIL